MMRCGSERLRDVLRSGTTPEIWVRFPRLLGDVVFTLPFLGSLQRHWDPIAMEAGVDLRWIAVGHASGAAIFSEANPGFIAESVIEANGAGKPGVGHLLQRWRKHRPAAVINLSQSVRLAMAAWLARVPVRAGDVNNHLGFLYQYRFTYRDLPTAVVERFRPLLVQLTGTDDLRWMPITPDRFGGRGGMEKLAAAGWNGRPYVTLAFGTRGLPKRWFPEEENWPALGRLLQDRGYDVVWLGGPDDAQQGRALSARVPGSYDLSGRTTIPEVCALQHAAAGNISIDTGLAHTAAGSGRPTVMINGISPEPLIHPLGPITLTVRGPSVDTEAASRTFETYGSSSFRIHPERILNLLEALMREDAGVPPHSGSGLQSAEGSRFWAPAPDRP